MNYQNRLLIVAVVCVAFNVNSSIAQILSPEMDMLQQVIEYDKVGKTQAEFDRLLQTATFLDDPQIANNLISHYLQTTNYNERVGIRIIMLYMTCQPERILMARLETETDPWKKARLLTLLDDFYEKEIFLTLIQQLDDIRPVILPPEQQTEPIADFRYNDLQRRVCDVAYLDLVSRLFRLGFLSNVREFDPPPFPSFDEMDTFITKFRQYWEEHQSSILEELPMKSRPATIMEAVVIKPKPHPPEIAMIAQVKAYIEEKRTRADLDALMQTAPFLNSLHAVSNLLDEVEKVHTQAEIDPVRVILLYMTCQPERVIQEWVWDIPDPWLHVKLFYLLEDIYRQRAFEVLAGELENVSAITLPPEAPSGSLGHVAGQRVCDRAYATLFLKLTALNLPGVEALQPPPGASTTEMDALIPLLQQYWQEHQYAIREILSHQSPPTILDTLF